MNPRCCPADIISLNLKSVNYLTATNNNHPSISNRTKDIGPGTRERKYIKCDTKYKNRTPEKQKGTKTFHALQARWGCGWTLACSAGLQPGTKQSGGSCSQEGQDHLMKKRLQMSKKLLQSRKQSQVVWKSVCLPLDNFFFALLSNLTV